MKEFNHEINKFLLFVTSMYDGDSKELNIHNNFPFLNQEFKMISCQFCRQSFSEYLYTTCHHFLCLQCCYSAANFSTLEIYCCHQSTTIERLSMTQIIKEHSTNNKISSPSPVAFSRHQSRSPVSEGKKSPNKSSNRKIMSGNTNESQWKQLKEENFKESSSFESSVNEDLTYIGKISSNNYQSRKENISTYVCDEIKESQAEESKRVQSKNVYQLENILLLQIQKVKKGFDEEHQILRRKEETLTKELIRVYEEEIKDIEKPISAAKLDQFNLSMSKFNNRIKEFIRNRNFKEANFHECSEQTKENSSEEDERKHYDHIIKRLDLNKERMGERIQRHLQILN